MLLILNLCICKYLIVFELKLESLSLRLPEMESVYLKKMCSPYSQAKIEYSINHLLL